MCSVKTWLIFPDYWEKCAGDEPSFIVNADTKEQAEKIAYPPPWNVTMGVRAIEQNDTHGKEFDL